MKITQYLFLALLLGLFGCEKEPGEGGTSSIRGKVEKEYRIVLSNAATYQYTVDAADEEIYIIYGDNVSPDDKVMTNFEGEFEFKNLRKGKYTIYVYSKDNSGIAGVDIERMVVKQEIEISDKGEDIEASSMTIYETP
jgi:hypothetical protein